MLDGDLKSLQHLWLNLASNQRYLPYVELRDLQEFNKRITNEGMTFLTRALPLIGKALDNFHSTKEWIPPEGFKTREGLVEVGDAPQGLTLKLNIPLFLSRAIKNALSGDPTAVDCVRQLSYIFYKLEIPHEKEVNESFLEEFERIDSGLDSFWFDHRQASAWSIVKIMRELIEVVLEKSNPLDIVPSHGSGATACRTPNWDKYHKLRYFPKLDDCFSYSEYFFFNPTHLVDELDKLEAAPLADPLARVCLVPKDSRGPRIISCEPAELMFIQQGLMKKLYKTIENHYLTRGQINFADQLINRTLAREGSITNALSTIDLSEASDRVSLKLVRAVFPPRWVEALEACRSESTQLPNGKVIKLNKFAPMGSSCCFPVEALVFWACAKAVQRIKHGVCNRAIYVYGDDIITEAIDTADVIEGLETIGLLVNRKKCFVDGPFRESCGGDFYLGRDVTPARLRKPIGISGTRLETTAEFCNNLIAKFGYLSVHKLITFIELTVKYKYPRTLLDLPGTIRDTPSASNDVLFKRRWNNNLHRIEHRILVTASKVKQRRQPDWAELFRKELTRGTLKQVTDSDLILDKYQNPLAIADSQLLPGYYTDPHSVRTKWEWVWLG